MYIAEVTLKGKKKFLIRESYPDKGIYRSRDLMALSDHPAAYVKYLNERSFYIDTGLQDQLEETGAKVDQGILETLFWPYIREDIKRRYETSFSRSSKNKKECLTGEGFHLFDRRRLYFLKFGGMDQRPIDRVPLSVFQVFEEKSRDEIEQMMMLKEASLRSKEKKAYVYVAFDLQRHFSSLVARQMPQALDPDAVERYLVENLCDLNRDRFFWRGMVMNDSLHDYLKRYLIMFVDTEYEESRFAEEYIFSNFHKRRYYRQQRRPESSVVSEASRIFNVPETDLKAMNRRDLKRLYRRTARELHPDRGGTHDQFVRLARVYEELLAMKATVKS